MSADRLFSRLNPLVGAVLRSPLHWLLSPGLALLSVTGRRSGRTFTFPVGYQRDGKTVTIAVSEAREKQWWRNLREPAEVELRLRGRLRRGRGELVAPESEAFRSAAETTLRRVPGMGRVFKVAFDRRTGLTDAQLEQLGREIAIVRIVLDEAPA
jgi:hypothetical protein